MCTQLDLLSMQLPQHLAARGVEGSLPDSHGWSLSGRAETDANARLTTANEEANARLAAANKAAYEAAYLLKCIVCEENNKSVVLLPEVNMPILRTTTGTLQKGAKC
jgi:hypothetical protein